MKEVFRSPFSNAKPSFDDSRETRNHPVGMDNAIPDIDARIFKVFLPHSKREPVFDKVKGKLYSTMDHGTDFLEEIGSPHAMMHPHQISPPSGTRVRPSSRLVGFES
jgi:hypothetical protein